MKRLIITLIIGLLILPTVSLAQNDSEFNSEQLALRTDLFNFLKEEGFMPELDSDGDIKFKAEGSPYFISISKTDENPMYVVMFRQFSNPDEYSAETIVMASKELNLYKGVKVLCFDNSFRIGAELFVRNAEPVKASFYKLKEIIDDVKSAFLDECKNAGAVSSSSGSYVISEIPFIVTQLEVGNTDENSNVIQDYGETIWDFKTKYLTPRITVKPFKSTGTYTIYVKLYKDGSLRTGKSSPSGYTYSSKVAISGNSSQVFTLPGWGSKTAGNWSMGKYRFEIWYGDYCIGSKTFQVE